LKVFVDGVEADLDPNAASVDRLPDRLVVKRVDISSTAVAIRSGDAVLISYRGQQFTLERHRPRSGTQGAAASGELRAPMPGLIVDVLRTEGSAVDKGDRILVMEAMKTQQAFAAPFAGTLAKLAVAKGDQVQEGDLLALVRAAAE
jgi:acetyl/propionyl-CoA carboxylase alpha subunit